jgi:perosamine synthetase
LLTAFKAEAIDGRIFFWPLSKLRLEKLPTSFPTPVAYSLHGRAVNLPSYHDLSNEEIGRVLDVVIKCSVK